MIDVKMCSVVPTFGSNFRDVWAVCISYRVGHTYDEEKGDGWGRGLQNVI